ncbi:MAG: hypothetical protein LC107_10925 [Chitinophagales bacterium]|nr:hypothetical protein [Chitinophagales bacterium]
MKQILLLILLVGSSLTIYGQSPGVALYTGLTGVYSSDRQVTDKGDLHYGWLVGADARIVEGDLYFIIGGQYIKKSLHSTSSPSFFKDNDFTVLAGRLGLGFNILHIGNYGVLRSKVLGSVNFVSKSPDNGLNIDGYKELNNSYMGILTGLGYTLGIFELDLEYQHGIFNAFYKQPDTKFNGFTLTAGVHF